MFIKVTLQTNFKVEVPNPIFPITPKFADFRFTGIFKNVTPANGKAVLYVPEHCVGYRVL